MITYTELEQAAKRKIGVSHFFAEFNELVGITSLNANLRANKRECDACRTLERVTKSEHVKREVKKRADFLAAEIFRDSEELQELLINLRKIDITSKIPEGIRGLIDELKTDIC